MATEPTEVALQDATAYAFDLFILYAPADADFVRGCLLPALGLPPSRVLLADALTPGALIASEIDRGVSRSRFTVVVLSPAYLEDRWAVFGEQLASYMSFPSVRVIPLRLTDCPLPLRLEARVALDFTDQANWESEAERLRELLYAACVSLGSGSVEREDRPTAARSRVISKPRKLELVDASFDENDNNDDKTGDRSSLYPALDLKMINRSKSTIVVKRVDVHVQAIWRLPDQIRDGTTLGILGYSASYELTIPDEAPPFILRQRVSHALKPDEVDRLRIALIPELDGDVVLSMVAKVVYDAESAEESSGELLCAFRDDTVLGHWDADAQRRCAQLAQEIRARKGHMSKKLLKLLYEMEGSD